MTDHPATNNTSSAGRNRTRAPGGARGKGALPRVTPQRLRRGVKPAGPRSRARFSPLRLALWAVGIALILAVAEQAVHNVLRHRAGEADPAAVSRVVAGDPVEPLGDRAFLPPGLREVPDARLPGTDGLAEGSAGMVATQLAYSRDSRLPVEVANSIGMRFRLVPPGTAIIGSPETEWGRGDIEVPHVVVFTEPVYMGKFEVTQAEYLEVMGENPSGFIGGNRPVEEVTWYDAQRFLVELAKREGIPDKVYRLPDEAEWEYACRAGTQTAFCFGDSPDRLGEYADTALNNFKSTAPVGRRLPNALGLFDMHGNVWEWCRDLFRPYPGGPAVGEEYLEWRSLRGGHWRAPADSCRSANRCRLAPTSHGNVLGFRVLRRIPELFETPPEPDPAEAGTKDSDG